MNSHVASVDNSEFRAGAPGTFERWLRTRLLRQMASLQECQLTIRDALGSTILGTPAQQSENTLYAEIVVLDSEFYRSVAANGSVGAGESYMDDQWRCGDLTTLMRILVRNRDRLDAMDSGLARLGGMAMRAWHSLRRNTRNGSRRNIAAHYDLGNDLFRLFLDENLMYSSAIYTSRDETLEVASTRKLNRICQKLALNTDDRLIEIGTGWGGFALHAAKNYGCHVTTTTISQEQFDLASKRVHEAGLEDRITLLLKDYRDLDGKFDKLVSIEMVEAIGHQYLDTYFSKVGDLLKDDGLALIQAITIEDHRYEQALGAVDFIKRHIFPGSFIPSISAMLGSIAHSSDMKLSHLEDIGPSYALTLAAWRERFFKHLPQVRALGYPERFIRMWEFYLCYCEGGFEERSIGDVHMLLAKPRSTRSQDLPDLNVSV